MDFGQCWEFSVQFLPKKKKKMGFTHLLAWSPSQSLKIHWRLSTIKNKQLKCMKWCFLIRKSMKVYSIRYVKKKFFRQNKIPKKLYSFFFCKSQLITALLLIHDSYTSWSTLFIFLKMRVGFSIFVSVSFLLRFIFLFKKKHRLFDFKAS